MAKDCDWTKMGCFWLVDFWTKWQALCFLSSNPIKAYKNPGVGKDDIRAPTPEVPPEIQRYKICSKNKLLGKIPVDFYLLDSYKCVWFLFVFLSGYLYVVIASELSQNLNQRRRSRWDFFSGATKNLIGGRCVDAFVLLSQVQGKTQWKCILHVADNYDLHKKKYKNIQSIAKFLFFKVLLSIVRVTT